MQKERNKNGIEQDSGCSHCPALCILDKKAVLLSWESTKIEKSIDCMAGLYYCLFMKWIHYHISMIRRNER